MNLKALFRKKDETPKCSAAVSYTHLDVYKRKDTKRMRASAL